MPRYPRGGTAAHTVINLDYNATTQPSAAVIDAMTRALAELWANPSSAHRAGQAVKAAIELARRDTASLVGARPNEIVFTSGGTESIVLALRGVLDATDRRAVVASTVEHSAIRDLVQDLARRGRIEARWAPVDSDGVVRLDALEELIDDSVALVSVQRSNNEVGTIQPIGEIGGLCREHGAVLHCDATAWAGRMPLDVRSEPIDLLTFSAHKFHGPKGVGVLWVRPGAPLAPQAVGSQELGRRAGTENVPGILGLGAAAREAGEWLEDTDARSHQESLRDRLEQRLIERVPGAVVNGAGAPRIWNTSSLAFPAVEAQALVMMLSERGVCVSAGSACASGAHEPSAVLRAIGVPEPVALGSIRCSLSRHTTPEEIDVGVDQIAACVGALRPNARG